MYTVSSVISCLYITLSQKSRKDKMLRKQIILNLTELDTLESFTYLLAVRKHVLYM